MITFWTVFIHIEPIMWRALAINTCVLFCLTWFLLKSFFVAFVSVFTCAMVVAEVYGVMMTVVQYNVRVAASGRWPGSTTCYISPRALTPTWTRWAWTRP